MNASERTVLEALMFGLGVPPSSARRPDWMDDGACIEHPEIEFIPANPVSEQHALEARDQHSRTPGAAPAAGCLSPTLCCHG